MDSPQQSAKSQAISYTVPDNEDGDQIFAFTEKTTGENDDMEDSIVVSSTPTLRSRSNRNALQKSLGDGTRVRKRKSTVKSKPIETRLDVLQDADTFNRSEVLATIAKETLVNRTNALIAKKDLFLPLLPGNNFITKSIEQVVRNSEHNVKGIIPYEELTGQPKGCVMS